MEPTAEVEVDLSLATTKQLLEALFNRKNLYGVFIWSDQLVRTGLEKHTDFNLVATGDNMSEENVKDALLQALDLITSSLKST